MKSSDKSIIGLAERLLAEQREKGCGKVTSIC